MNEILFLRFFTALATTNADDPDIHAANDYAISLVKSNRAALTRAEAAEAEAARLRNERDVQQSRIKTLLNRNSAQAARMRTAAARVAELEAQLAAPGWRPVTDDWPPYNERVIIGYGGGYGGGWSAFARRVRTDNRDGDDWLMDDDTTLAFESAVVAMRRPLPPAPAPQEPTP